MTIHIGIPQAIFLLFWLAILVSRPDGEKPNPNDDPEAAFGMSLVVLGLFYGLGFFR